MTKTKRKKPMTSKIPPENESLEALKLAYVGKVKAKQEAVAKYFFGRGV